MSMQSYRYARVKLKLAEEEAVIRKKGKKNDSFTPFPCQEIVEAN